MKRKAKLPFDPKAFLAKAEWGEDHLQISKESNRLLTRRSGGFRLLHP